MKICHIIFSVNYITVMLATAEGFRKWIPKIKAEFFWHHIAMQNALLHLEFQQANFTDTVLFATYDSRTFHNLLLAVESSTKFDQIAVKVRSRSQTLYNYMSNISLDSNGWNQIILTLNGSVMELFLNCTSVMLINNIDPEFPKGNVRMLLGQNKHKRKQLHGTIRRFSVEPKERFNRYCSTPKSWNNEITGRNDMFSFSFQDDEKVANINLMLEEIVERLFDLETNVSKWLETMNLHDQKLRRKVELYQKSCQVDNRLIIIGQKYRDNTTCTECVCTSHGEMTCGRIGCATLECEHPVLPSGQCCPICAKECFYNERRWQNGQQYWPKNCVRCICDNGNMDCQFLESGKCTKLDCYEQEIPPNQCCPVCINIDFCGLANPCDPNAICNNGNYGAECQCRTGFFGNGTVCHDVDECAWDDIAREQLGGCLSGTICINLPGSFKCECLPGYQKLNDRSCMDVIRV